MMLSFFSVEIGTSPCSPGFPALVAECWDFLSDMNFGKKHVMIRKT